MKAKFKVFSVLLVTVLLVSCVTGDYMAMKSSEHTEVLGMTQATFNINGAYRYRRTINMNAYFALMAEAQKQYPDIDVDVRDISWAIGQGDSVNNNFEYSAIGKVVKAQNN